MLMLLLRSLAMLIAKPAARPATPAGPAHLLPLASLLTALLLAPAIPAQAELAVTRGSALAVSSASQPVPDGRQDWTYTLKAGESFVEVARELLRSHISIPRLASYNGAASPDGRSEEHTSELQSRPHLVCRLLLEKKKNRPERSTHPHTCR